MSDLDFCCSAVCCGIVGAAVVRFVRYLVAASKIANAGFVQACTEGWPLTGRPIGKVIVAAVALREREAAYRMLFYAAAVCAVWGWVR